MENDTAAEIDELFLRNFGEGALAHFRKDEDFILKTGEGGPNLRVAGEDFPLDSLDRLEFVMTVEDHFSIDIPEEAVMDFTKRSEVIAFVDKMLAGG